MLKVFSLPVLKDNYVHILADLDRGTCVIVDPGEAAPVLKFISENKLRPLAILLTHHHWDHTDGVKEIQKTIQESSASKAPLLVYAPAREKSDIPFADHYMLAGDRLKIMELDFEILALPGHTLGHIAYYEAEQAWLFSGDVLFSLGCGRVFEGTMVQHYESLQKLKALPPETTVYCTHEYTERNTLFCLQEFPESRPLQLFLEKVRALRAKGMATVPFQLKQELELNPFLQAKDLPSFTALREARNYF